MLPVPPGAPYLIPNTPSCPADAPKGVEILLNPSEGNIRPGDLVTLTCQVNSSYPSVSSVQWVKDGTRLKAQSHMLQLSQAAWDDAGVYTCQAENDGGSSASPPVSLHVFSESGVNLGVDQRAGKGSRPQRPRGCRCGFPVLPQADDKPPWQGGMSGGPRRTGQRCSRLRCRRGMMQTVQRLG